MSLRVLISAGEASGDLYAAALVEEIRRGHPNAQFFGCAGPRMRDAGVRAVVRAESLSVVGLVEVLAHIPRIYNEFRKLIAAADAERPDVAVLTDSPDFHLRVAARLKPAGFPIAYLVAPQAWAWRQGRVKKLRALVDHLFCIFPFEEKYFRDHQVPATYIGHPLARMIRPSIARTQFLAEHGIDPNKPLIAVLPGSRSGEAARHLEPLAGAAELLRNRATFVAGSPRGFAKTVNGATFWERFHRASIQIVEGTTWDLLAHSDLALAASGTVTIEAALLGKPMITFYRVSPLTWALGRKLVRVPFLSMVNLVAERKVVPELMQNEMTAANLAREAVRLLEDAGARDTMQSDLAGVRARLTTTADPMQTAADVLRKIIRISQKDTVNVG